MIPQLPVELLRHVFSNLSPPRPTVSGLDDSGGSSTLGALCLVSKVFHQIARPLLYNFVTIRRKDGQDPLLELVENNKGTAILDRVESVYIEMLHVGKHCHDEDDEMSDEEIGMKGLMKELSQACDNLDNLVLYRSGLSLSYFLGSNVRRLDLYDASLCYEIDSTFYLPLLDTLGIFESELIDVEFGIANFPSLRHFAFQGDTAQHVEGLLGNFALQLDAVFLDFEPFVVLRRPRHQPNFPVDKVLVEISIDYITGEWGQEEDLVRHFRIDCSQYPFTVEDLEDLEGVIGDDNRYRNLESLWLPLLDEIDDGGDPSEVNRCADALLLACRDRRIEVVFEMAGDKTTVDGLLSKEFMRKMTEKRLSKDLQASK